MVRGERVPRSSVHAWWLVTAIGLLIGAAPRAMAQFGLPKLPKVPKVGKAEPKSPPAKQPEPEITSITPSSVPPGWEGDVVFAGKNFAKNMKLRISCGAISVTPGDFHLESGERATIHLKVADSTEEEKSECVIALEVPLAGSSAETDPSPEGTPLVVQVTGATFTVSGISPLPQTYRACFIIEGDLSPMDLAQKLGEALQRVLREDCKLVVSADSLKYTDQGKTILDEPASAVKTLEPVLMMGQPMDIFRILLTSGKVFNFFVPNGYDKDHPMEEQIKRKLKK